MQLSKYQQLVQNGILNNMEFSDLFMFSFVSEKMKKLIKSSPQMKRFESVNTIRYDHRNGRTIVCIPYRYRHHKILKISEGDEIKNDCFQLNVSGKMIDFR
ncbi:Protein CBG15404 [Caenorhabditis briggsae]|uniref:Protein CBG15404 n=1 Tax=Caenorhabditis briggsae TaxID=6238 RepID=A8XMC7_CAEBR|nr:Protein CBG15404 [Caenorhabditis briggsae]CAP33802.2 Protein CBG15404 [Caenorhabditis briggsae]